VAAFWGVTILKGEAIMVVDFGIAFGALAGVGFFKTLEFEASLLMGPAVELGAEPLPSC
jgi:hypothetical protein